MQSALGGLLVLEIGSRTGVKACGSLLAQLGATVLLVRDLDSPSTRTTSSPAPFDADKCAIFTRDCRDAVLKQLASEADVILLSSDQDGQEPDWVAAARSEAAIVCDITAYGQSGPMAGRPDLDWQIQARTGVAATTGLDDGPPVIIPFPVIEMMTATYSASAILAALITRSACGLGQRIDMALYDCAFAAIATFLPKPLTGDPSPIRRLGNRHAMIAPWNVYKAADGWILICVGSDAQWGRLCEIIGRRDLISNPDTAKTAQRIRHTDLLDETIQSWIAEQSVESCVSLLNEVNIACGPVVPVKGYPREPNLEHRQMICRLKASDGKEIVLCGSPFKMSASPGRHPRHSAAELLDEDGICELIAKQNTSHRPWRGIGTMPELPLKGVRVIEIGHYTTVPLATKLLGSLGAEIIKIEPPEGETTRDWPPTHDGQGYFFTLMNSDKSSLVLDLRDHKDVEVLTQLIAASDVLIENLKPGALARRGFSRERIATLNKDLIYCCVSGFGADSLYSGRPAYDSVIQAMSGLMDLVRSNGIPLKTGISSSDLMGGEMAVLSIHAALLHRLNGHGGQSIDLSMQDITAWLSSTEWINKAQTAPQTLVLIDGAIAIDKTVPHDIDVNPVLEMSRDEALDFLLKRGVVAAPILSVHEMLTSEQTRSRQLWLEVRDRGTSWPLLTNPMRLQLTPPRVERPMPSLGYDSDAIRNKLRQSSGR